MKAGDKKPVFPETCRVDELLPDDAYEDAVPHVEFNILNQSDQDIIIQNWYCLDISSDGELRNIIYPQYYNRQYHLYLPAGEQLSIFIPEHQIKEKSEFYVWAY